MIERLSVHLVLALRDPAYQGSWRTPEVEAELRKAFVDQGAAVVADDWTAMIPPGVKPEDVKAAVFRAARELGVA
jgi:hypothetical protein